MPTWNPSRTLRHETLQKRATFHTNLYCKDEYWIDASLRQRHRRDYSVLHYSSTHWLSDASPRPKLTSVHNVEALADAAVSSREPPAALLQLWQLKLS